MQQVYWAYWLNFYDDDELFFMKDFHILVIDLLLSVSEILPFN